MKRFAIVMAAVLAVAITACNPEPEPNNEKKTGSNVKVVNDQEELAQYVTNYKAPSSNSAAAPRHIKKAAEEWSMPELPTSTDGMTKVECPSWKWGDLNGNTNFYVAAGETLDFTGGGLNANNKCNLYIYGTLILPSFSPAQGANVYIAPGGKLQLTGNPWDQGQPGLLKNDTPTNLYIYNGAEYVGSYTSASKTGLYVEGDVNVGDAELGGKVFVAGKLTANALTTNNSTFQAAEVEAATWTYMNDSKVYVETTIAVDGDVTINAQNVAIECQEYLVGGNFHMENNSVLIATEHIGVTGDCEISTQGIVETPCMTVAQKLYIKNCATMNIAKAIYCDDFEASASGFAINMGGNALIKSNKNFTIQNKNWAIRFNNTEDAQSAIVAEKFQIMEGQAGYITGYAFLSAAEYWGKPSENFQYYAGEDNYRNYILQETVKPTVNGVTVTSDPNDCTPEFTTGVDVPEPPTITELISSISHTHDISATCVALYNNKAYLSWHKRGTSIHGCLEALKVQNDVATLTSWMEVEDGTTEGGDNYGGNSAVSGADEAGESQGQFDFNHLVVAEGKVVTVGDNAKMGGFIGAIALDAAGDFGTNGTLQDAFKSRQLLGKVTQKVGRSGNVVLYANGKYYIACAGGFQEYNGNLDDLFVKDGNKWVASLGDYELTAGSAKHITINQAGDKVATLEFTSRNENKVDPDYWFNDFETSLNAKLKVRDANNWLNSTPDWEVEIDGIAPIYGKNTIAFDTDGKIYVCAGRKGLLVYDNGVLVGQYSRDEDIPAAGVNGVAIDDKYVYVAYGISGLWILDKAKLLAGVTGDECVVSWYKSNAPEGYETSAVAASANYIALDGEYIYVAYGRHGVKVLKLSE